jgi:release factor glutamine methyltransferase
MRLLDALKSSTECLEKAGVEDAFVDAEILTFDAAGMDRLPAYMDNPEISKELLARIRRTIERRVKGEPLQYIVGHVEFLGMKIYVGKGVLIPRPETELLAEEAIETISKGGATPPERASSHHPPLQVLDLCTGSGCIALSIAKAFPEAKIHGTDVSKAALRFAKKNAEANGLRNVTFLKGSLFEPLPEDAVFDLIVSNPPYIISSDIAGLQREIRDWEPVKALNGGKDGLDFYRKIFAQAGRYLRRGGIILCELGFGQSVEVSTMAKGSGFSKIFVKKDYAGIERILKAEF